MANIAEVTQQIKNGEVAILPTDTLFALSASAVSDEAVSKIYKIKGREAAKALPVFVSNFEMATKLIEVNNKAKILAKKFWPGKLTIVGKYIGTDISRKIINAENTLGVRIPNCEHVLSIIDSLGHPITATSANLSGEQDCLTYEDLENQFGHALKNLSILKISKQQQCSKPSTIVKCVGDDIKVLRLGAISMSDIESAFIYS